MLTHNQVLERLYGAINSVLNGTEELRVMIREAICIEPELMPMRIIKAILGIYELLEKQREGSPLEQHMELINCFMLHNGISDPVEGTLRYVMFEKYGREWDRQGWVKTDRMETYS